QERLEHRRPRLVASADDADLPVERRVEPRRRELPPPHLRRHPKPRRDREPEPRLDELLDRLRVAELHRRRRDLARAAEPVVDHAAERRPPLEEDQRRAHQIPRGRPMPAPPAPVRRRDRDDLVPVERRHRELTLAHRQAHDADVELATDDRARDLGRVPGDDGQLRPRVARPEPPERRGQEVDRERGARPEPDASGHDPAELLDDLEARLELPQRPARATIGHGPEPVRAGAGRPRQARATPGGGRAARARHQTDGAAPASEPARARRPGADRAREAGSRGGAESGDACLLTRSSPSPSATPRRRTFPRSPRSGTTRSSGPTPPPTPSRAIPARSASGSRVTPPATRSSWPSRPPRCWPSARSRPIGPSPRSRGPSRTPSTSSVATAGPGSAT